MDEWEIESLYTKTGLFRNNQIVYFYSAEIGTFLFCVDTNEKTQTKAVQVILCKFNHGPPRVFHLVVLFA